MFSYAEYQGKDALQTAHITLIQGVFKGNSIGKLINAIKETASNIKATKITMADKFVKGVGESTFYM